MLFCLFVLLPVGFFPQDRIEKKSLDLRHIGLGFWNTPLNQKGAAGQWLPHTSFREEDSRTPKRDVLFSPCFNHLSTQTDKCGPIFVRFDLAHPADHCSDVPLKLRGGINYQIYGLFGTQHEFPQLKTRFF